VSPAFGGDKSPGATAVRVYAFHLTALRSDAKVTNYLARRLVETQGKMPSLQPSAPTGK
jgi:hypothetical protein